MLEPLLKLTAGHEWNEMKRRFRNEMRNGKCHNGMKYLKNGMEDNLPYQLHSSSSVVRDGGEGCNPVLKL